MKLRTPFQALAAAMRIPTLPNGFAHQQSQTRLFTTSVQRNKTGSRDKKSLKNRPDPRISAHLFPSPSQLSSPILSHPHRIPTPSSFFLTNRLRQG